MYKLLFINFFCKCLNAEADLCKMLVVNNLIAQILNIEVLKKLYPIPKKFSLQLFDKKVL